MSEAKKKLLLNVKATVMLAKKKRKKRDTPLQASMTPMRALTHRTNYIHHGVLIPRTFSTT